MSRSRRKRGAWLTFTLRDPKVPVARIATPCISTSAESAGHFISVLSAGRIVGISDKVKDVRRNVRDASAHDSK